MGSRVFIARLVPVFLLFCADAVRGQVFVVGAKTAEADVVTEFHPTHVSLPDQPLDERGRLELIRDLEAEQGFAHREIPMGAGLVLLANGRMTPGEDAYKKMLYEKGQSAGPGDRVEITRLEVKGDRMILDLNGGPYAKHRFLSHLELDGMQMAQQGPIPTGCRITLVFEGGIPEVSAAEVKALLDPLVDFKAKTSGEAYADTLPPKAREAVAEHQVLVGMNRRMVLAALGQPQNKHRERNGDDVLYEEWIYGKTPEPIQFVRFQHDRVVRLEIAELGKPVQVHDRNEMGTNEAPLEAERTILNGDVDRRTGDEAARGTAPTLRKPGDPDETVQGGSGMGKVNVPKTGGQNMASAAAH